MKKSKNWLSAYRYYSLSYYAGVVKVVPQRSITPIANRPFSSPATGSPTHPIYVASTQASPASGTPTHPYIIPSTSNSPRLDPAFRQTTTEPSSIPASFTLALSQGSPSPSFPASFTFALSQGSPSPVIRQRQFLRAPTPVALPLTIVTLVPPDATDGDEAIHTMMARELNLKFVVYVAI